MIRRSKHTINRAISIFAFVVNTGVIGYTAATRFTDFLFAPRDEKLALLAGCIALAAILSALIYLVFFKNLIRAASARILILVLLCAMFITGLVFYAVYVPPPFPEQHTLTVTALGDANPLSSDSRVHILSVSTVSYPSRATRRIPKAEFGYHGAWRGISGNDFEILVDGGRAAGFEITRFMQAGVEIKFETGPDGGLVRVSWDGREEVIDLYHPQNGEHIQRYAPALDWRHADRTRKLLVGGALLADFTAAASVIFVLFMAVIAAFSKKTRLKIRKIPLIAISTLIFIASFLVIQQVNTPVGLENPALELGIRKALNRPQGPIYQRQLRGLVELDLSGTNITTLQGVQQLENLVSLDLRDNQVLDLSPLADLKKLEKLNLRNNRITDLTPLSALEQLEYLNLFGNSRIRSIRPLASLTKLNKLILSGVPVGDQGDTLRGLTGLNYLNLKGCGLQNITFLSPLARLTYLNLHSNPNIRSLTVLGELGNLETLILADIPLQDQTAAIARLSKLTYLNLRNTGLSDISFLSGLRRLEYLNLHTNPHIQSIAPLEKLANLEHLILRNVPINGQTASLTRLTRLKTLNVRSTGLTNLNFLAELIAQGALQDDPRRETIARLDIRDNPIPSGEGDAYAGIRPFWENITLKEPLLLPFYAALEAPAFSAQSGFFDEGFLLSIVHPDRDTTITYTLDGSEPTTTSTRYTSPIAVDASSYPPRSGAGVESIAANWKAPSAEIQRAVIVRARAFGPAAGQISPVVTHTYFIGPEMKDRYTLPVISLVTAYDNFFDGQDGIYSLGDAYQAIAKEDLSEDEKQAFANFNQRGKEWEKPVHLELFDLTGQPVFGQDGGVRIHGGGSRRNAQKSLRVYADCAYDSECLFTTPIFQITDETRNGGSAPVTAQFLLRNHGQDWLIGNMRDALAQDVLRETNLDLQTEQPVVAFLNGEYWGIYQLQERYDSYYFLNHYGIQPEEVTILRQNGKLFRGNPQDARRYADLVDFIRSHDLADPENYAFVESQVDIENYTDYLIANIFLANTDWPSNNIYMWRRSLESNNLDAGQGYDGRWRWMIFDMDFAFGLQGYGSGYEHNTLQLAQMEGWGGDLFRSLLKNNTYTRFFINRFAHQMNTTFAQPRLLDAIDRKQRELAPEMDEHLARWGANKDDLRENWAAEINDIREFAIQRRSFVEQHLADQFGLTGTSTVHIHSDPGQGTVLVNGDPISETENWEGVYFNGVPLTITVVPEPGTMFSHWKETGATQSEITLELSADIWLTPVFRGDQSE